MSPRMKPRAKAQAGLTSLARGFVVVVDRSILREMMLISGGVLTSKGLIKGITTKHLGAGVYRLKLEEEA